MRSPLARSTAGIIALALALALALTSIAAPASARVFNRNAQGSIVFPQPAPSAPLVGAPHASGAGLDWGYVAIGSGAAALGLLGIAGTLAISRRLRSAPARSTTKA
jgi:hypothetical protein